MNEYAVTKEMWMHWKEHPVTQEFFRRINVKREGIKEELAEGSGGKDIDVYIGQCQAFRDAIVYGLHEFEVIDQEEENQDD